MAKKKFDYNNPTDGVEFYYICDGEVMWALYYIGYYKSLVKNHNFFRTRDGALEACEKMKELFKKIQEEEKEK